MDGVERDRVFTALTRPQMFAGVTYSFFVANAVLAAELFLIARTAWALALAVVVHLVGVVLCLGEPRFFDLWLTRIGRCPAERHLCPELPAPLIANIAKLWGPPASASPTAIRGEKNGAAGED